MGKVGTFFTQTNFNRGNTPLVRLSTFPLGTLFFIALCAACSETSEKTPPTVSVHPPSVSTREIEHNSILDKAQTLLAEGKFQKAVTICQNGLALDSTSVILLNILATAYASEGRYALAIEALDKIRILEPTKALTYLNLGGIYTKLGQYGQAENLLQRALQLAPNQPETHRRLGEVFLGTDRFQKAAHHFSAALELFPQASTLNYYLGRAYEGMGETRSALESFTRAAQLDSGFTECFYRMAQLARRVGQHELARSSMIRFKELQQIGSGDPDIPKQMKKLRASILNAPESPLHHEKLGYFFAQHDYVNEAENLYRLTSQLPGIELDRLTRMGKHMLRLNRPETALFLFQQGSKQRPQHIPTLLNAGVALEMLGKNTEAQAFYKRVQGLAPQDPRGWYAMGLSEFNAGRLEEAEVAWEKSLHLTSKSSPLRREIGQRLTDLSARK